MRDVKKSHYNPTIGSDIFIRIPFFFVVTHALIVWLVVRILVVRVLDAFVKDFFGVIRSIWPLCPSNSVRKAEVVKECWQVVRMIFDIELLVQKMLNLLFFPRLAFTQKFDEFGLLIVIELRGPTAPEVRCELP